jgi:hypothetical protein
MSDMDSILRRGAPRRKSHAAGHGRHFECAGAALNGRRLFTPAGLISKIVSGAVELIFTRPRGIVEFANGKYSRSYRGR